MAKLAKSAVEFEHPAKGPHHCSQCRHYRGDQTCEIVAGRVLPRDWCEKFADKHAARQAAYSRHLDNISRG